jgi:hypothetical protein
MRSTRFLFTVHPAARRSAVIRRHPQRPYWQVNSMMSAVKATSSSGVVGILRCVDPDADPGLGMPPSAVHPGWRQYGPHTHGDVRNLEVSPRGFLQYKLVARQVRDRPPKPPVLSLQFFQPLNLTALKPAILVAPAVVCNFRHSYRQHRIRDWLVRCHQHIELPQLRDNLLCRLSFPCHLINPPWSKPHFREDHSKGEGQGTSRFRPMVPAQGR